MKFYPERDSTQPMKFVPWELMAPHEAQARLNHYQSLDELASRGGLSADEAVAVLEDRQWCKMPKDEAVARLAELVNLAAAAADRTALGRQFVGPSVDFRAWWDSKDHTYDGDATPLSIAGMAWEAAHQKYAAQTPTPKTVQFTPEEVQMLSDALWVARCDIWQTARVSEYNLTGKDPNFPDDEGTPPMTPKLIHREGLTASYQTFDQVVAALAMLSQKSKKA